MSNSCIINNRFIVTAAPLPVSFPLQLEHLKLVQLHLGYFIRQLRVILLLLVDLLPPRYEVLSSRGLKIKIEDLPRHPQANHL